MKILKRQLLLSSMIVSAVLSAGCAHYNFRIIVQDNDDHAIPGALVYVESYNQKGAMDFTWVKVGESIDVPPPNEPAIKLNGSNETFVAIAVLAEGKKPVVMIDPSGVLKPEMWEYMVEDQNYLKLQWEPKIAEMQFPFIHQYDLKERLKKKANWPLVHAFHRVYQPLGVLVEQNKVGRSEKEKYEYFIDKIYNPVIELEALEMQEIQKSAK